MDERTTIAWLYRRAGFGLAPGELDAAEKLGIDATLDRLVDPDGAGVDPAADPWAGQQFVDGDPRPQILEAIDRWSDHLSTTSRPLESWMVWYWHGHFATSVAKVKRPELMVGQLRTFQALGMGRFPELLEAVTIDPAMLIWLDGADSTGAAPNENYGREVLELFALGQGSFAEREVIVGAQALTGWKLRRQEGYKAVFVPWRHDRTRRHYLGQDGVHNLKSVVDAITAYPECGPFVARRMATEMLGETAVDDGLVSDLAKGFVSSELDIRTLVRSILEAGLARLEEESEPPREVVLGPVPWLAAARRATEAKPRFKEIGKLLRAAGQVPMAPPDVGGWPGGQAWLDSSTVVALYQLAGLVAAASPTSNPARAAAIDGDDDRLADALGRPEGFTTTTRDALATAARAGGPPGVARLTLALASLDLTLA